MKARWLVVLLLCLCVSATAAGYLTRSDMETLLTDALAARAARADDPWVAAILSGTPRAIALATDERGEPCLRFELPAWDPGLDALPETYDGDAETWIAAIRAHALDETMACTLPLLSQDGAWTVGDSDAFTADVRAAAAVARSGFDDPRVRQALAGQLLPTDFDAGAGGAYAALCRLYGGVLSPERLRGALSLPSKQVLYVTDGPAALRLAMDMPADLETVERDAFDAALASLKARYRANAMSDRAIEAVFADCLVARSARYYAEGGKTSQTVLRVDFVNDTAPARSEAYTTLIDALIPDYETLVGELIARVRLLPDQPPLDPPTSGRLTGSEDGTPIEVVTPSSAAMQYFRLENADGTVALSAFNRPGETCTVYAPAGAYTLFLASGDEWFGEGKLFGEAGLYARLSAPIEIAESGHYHRLTLGGAQDDALAVEAVPYSEIISDN